MGRIITPSGSAYSRKDYPLAGPFGSGTIIYYTRNATFVVPNPITTVRVRLWGGGSSGRNGYGGNSSSFGAYVSATGGQTSSGGTGTGGDINTTGGGTGFYNLYGPGGGSAANLFGNGSTHGASGFSGGGGWGTGTAATSGQNGGNGLTGRGGLAGIFEQTARAGENTDGLPLGEFSIDLIGCGPGGGGGATNAPGGSGFNGGGGGGGNNSAAGRGGFPGGGGGSHGVDSIAPNYSTGGTGGGFAIKTITGLTPGTSIPVTVAAVVENGGAGLVIVEY